MPIASNLQKADGLIPRKVIVPAYENESKEYV